MLEALLMSSGVVDRLGRVAIPGALVTRYFQPVTAVHLMAKGCIFGAAGRVALTAIGEAMARAEECSGDGQK